jgi:hypothetical protein
VDALEESRSPTGNHGGDQCEGESEDSLGSRMMCMVVAPVIECAVQELEWIEIWGSHVQMTARRPPGGSATLGP